MVLFIFAFSSNAQFDNFITVSDNKFMDGSSEFKPLFLNYVIRVTIDQTKNDYFISPEWNYSTLWGYPNTGGEGRYCFSLTDDRNASAAKLASDFIRIKSMGFNVVRIASGINWSNGNIVYPTGNKNTYLSLMNDLFNQLADNNLRAVFVLNASTNSYKYNEQFKAFLDNISSYFKDNKTIMAYVLYAEPFYTWQKLTKNDKLLIANWSREWYYIMKKNAPNQLITYGLQHPETVINWDPGYMTSDFMSFHFYNWSNDLESSNNNIASYSKWISANYKDIWVMGETGFSGTDITSEQDYTTGTDQQQKDFATFNIQRNLDCGSKGYAWWQYQELDWRSTQNPEFWENHLGLITRYPIEVDKLAVSSFSNYNNLVVNTNNCVKPSNYYNRGDFTNISLMGTVVDNSGSPLRDAVIVGWKDIGNGQNRMYFTFSDDDGNFNLYADHPDKIINQIWISHLGHTALKINNPLSNSTYSIQSINYNNWMKMWTNDNNSTLCGWHLRDIDKFYNGDFDGDGKDELLCIQIANKGWANMYNFDNGEWSYKWSNSNTGLFGEWLLSSYDKFFVGDFNGDDTDEILRLQSIDGSKAELYSFINGQWDTIWSNHGDGWLCGWYIRNGDKFYPGDFDGDGLDELMCIQSYNNGFANMYNFSNGSWSYNWTNGGNGYIGEWNIRASDKYYIGDFDGDNRKELFCVQSTGGVSDSMTSLRFNGKWSRQWSNNGDNSYGIYPYRDKLVVGNFDTDGQDEILGIYTWATKFDFSHDQFGWSWSTGDKAKLSDWAVNRNANCFFIKMLKEGPDYLCNIEKLGNNYGANLYSMNNLIQGKTIALKSSMAEEDVISNLKSEDVNQSTDNVKLYPNPTNGIFRIEVISPVDDQISIYIYNEIGVCVSNTFKNVTKGSNIFELDQSVLLNGLYFISLQGNNTSYTQKLNIID